MTRGDVLANLHDAELRGALLRQRAELAAALQRLEHAPALLPPVDDTRWQGPARSAYETALQALRGQLAAATAILRRAYNQTCLALAALDG